MWHLVAYQAYFDGLIAAALPGTAPTAPRPAPASCLNNAGSNLVEVRGAVELSSSVGVIDGWELGQCAACHRDDHIVLRHQV